MHFWEESCSNSGKRIEPPPSLQQKPQLDPTRPSQIRMDIDQTVPKLPNWYWMIRFLVDISSFPQKMILWIMSWRVRFCHHLILRNLKLSKKRKPKKNISNKNLKPKSSSMMMNPLKRNPQKKNPEVLEIFPGNDPGQV